MSGQLRNGTGADVQRRFLRSGFEPESGSNRGGLPMILHFALPILHLRWLPNMDLNHDKQIQSLLCYHYTIRHARCGNQGIDFGRSVKPLAERMNGWLDEWMSAARGHSSIHPLIHS